MRTFVLLLASTDLSGALGEYLRAEPGSEAESAAVERIRVWYDRDPAVVEEAIRHHVEFPAAEAGLSLARVPLTGLEGVEGAPEKGLSALWVPKGYDPTKKYPVLLVAHGASGRAEAEVSGLSPFADEHGLILLAPQDELNREGGGWGFGDYDHAIHVQALTWLKRHYSVDDDRVVVFGGSRGGHAAWDLSMNHPELFAGAIAVVGGPKNHGFRWLPNLLHVPLLDMQGAHDQAGLIENLHDAVKVLKGLDYDVTYEEDPDAGHWYAIDWKRVATWLGERCRAPYPDHVIRVASRNDRASAYWLRLRDLPEKRFAKIKPPTYDPRGGPLTRDEQKALVRDNYAKYTAKVEGRIANNVVDLTVSKAPKIEVYLHDDLIDFDEKVTFHVNGRERTSRKLTRSLETLLTRWKQTGDRSLLFHAKVTLRGTR